MILIINALICLAIAVRLFLFQRIKHDRKLSCALLAWGLICSSASVAIFIVFNEINHAQKAQALMNLLTLICIIKTKGNVSDFMYRVCYQSKLTSSRQHKKAPQKG